MRKVQIILLTFCMILLNNCKRGSPFSNANAKLSNNNGMWSLVSYKVNDVDSTDLINFGNFANFKSKFFIATLSSKTAGMPECINRLYTLTASFEDKNKIFKVAATQRTPNEMLILFDNDTCQSVSLSNCQRNVFMPEGIETSWKIEKFKNGQFELSCKQKNSYSLKLKSN